MDGTGPIPERGRILVVDDEPEICRMLVRLLKAEHEVSWSTDPVEALSWIRDGQRFDVIISDVMMPRLSGLDLLTLIQQIDPDQAARLVFLTASVLPGDLEATFAGVPNTVFRKPLNIAELRAFVRERVAASSLRRG